MGFSTGGRGSRASISEINVTPFVDVMLVLLIIFMVTAPLMQQGIDVQLPETSSAGVSVTEEPLTLVIKKNKTLYIGKTKVPVNGLRKKIKAIMKTRKNKQVYLQADKRVEYGFVANTMAEIRSAGIYSIGLITLPK